MLSCLMLAAGESKRMGLRNKLLLTVEGGPLVRRTAKEISKYPFQECVFVTGYESELITPELISFDARIVHNPHYKSGIHASIRVGLRALTRPCEGAVIVHADRPRFHVEVIYRLAQVFQTTRGPRLAFPTWRGRRGHPLLVSKEFFPEILAEPDGDYDLGYLLRRNLSALLPVAVPDAGVVEDIDVPEDLQALEDCRGER